jgi:hypothetical protein
MATLTVATAIKNPANLAGLNLENQFSKLIFVSIRIEYFCLQLTNQSPKTKASNLHK